MGKLFLVRHAKSSKAIPEWRDIDRPLNERGYADARFTGKLLAKKKIKAGFMISSPAVRAITTSLIFAGELKYPYSEIKLMEEVYSDDFRSLLKALEWLKPTADNVFLFGHNPALDDLLRYVLKTDAPAMKTCDVVCLDTGRDYKLSKKSHELLAVYSPVRTDEKLSQ